MNEWITVYQQKVNYLKTAFSDYSQTIYDDYRNLENYNKTKKKKTINSLWWHDSKYEIKYKSKFYSH